MLLGASLRAILAVATFRESAMTSLTLRLPLLPWSALRTVYFQNSSFFWSAMMVSGVTRPRSRAAVAVKIFITEPGSYWSLKTRLRSLLMSSLATSA